MNFPTYLGDVRFWPKADIRTGSKSVLLNGCFGEISGHSGVRVTGKGEWPQSTHSGPWQNKAPVQELFCHSYARTTLTHEHIAMWSLLGLFVEVKKDETATTAHASHPWLRSYFHCDWTIRNLPIKHVFFIWWCAHGFFWPSFALEASN